MGWTAQKSEPAPETTIRHDRRSARPPPEDHIPHGGPPRLSASPETGRLNDLDIRDADPARRLGLSDEGGLVAGVRSRATTQHAQTDTPGPPTPGRPREECVRGIARPFPSCTVAVLLAVGWFTLTCNHPEGRLRRVAPESLSPQSAIRRRAAQPVPATIRAAAPAWTTGSLHPANVVHEGYGDSPPKYMQPDRRLSPN
jgi:hypothetical protein